MGAKRKSMLQIMLFFLLDEKFNLFKVGPKSFLGERGAVWPSYGKLHKIVGNIMESSDFTIFRVIHQICLVSVDLKSLRMNE